MEALLLELGESLSELIQDVLTELGVKAVGRGESVGRPAALLIAFVARGDDLVERARWARSHAPGAALVLLFPFDTPHTELEARRVGADGCFRLDGSLSSLRQTLRLVVTSRALREIRLSGTA